MVVIDSFQFPICFSPVFDDDELTYSFLSFIISFYFKIKKFKIKNKLKKQLNKKKKKTKTFFNHWYFFHKSFLNVQLHHINLLEMFLIYHLFLMIYYTFLYNLHI